MILKKWTLPISMACALSACHSPKIFLSKEEKNFGDSITQKYQCEVSMQHDYKAVKENKKDGTFWIELKNPQHEDLCAKDSTFLKNFASNITKQLFQIIKYKYNYSTMEVVFYKSEHPDKQTEHTLCEKHLTVSTSDFNNVQVTYWH